jgi:hypothetical protein
MRWGFDLEAWDARAASIAERARITASRHRHALLGALESRDDDAVADKLELMVRTVDMAAGKRHALAGMALTTARTKPRRQDINDWISRQLRRNPDAKSPALWAEAPDWLTDQIQFGRFEKRVTAVRKMRKTDASQ